MRPISNVPCLFVIRHGEEKKDIWVKIYHWREWWLAERVVDLLSSDDLGDRPRSGVWRVVVESGQCRARLSRLGTQDPRTSSVLTTAHHSSFIQKVNQFSFECNILENIKNSRFLRNDSVFLTLFCPSPSAKENKCAEKYKTDLGSELWTGSVRGEIYW